LSDNISIKQIISDRASILFNRVVLFIEENEQVEVGKKFTGAKMTKQQFLPKLETKR